jgi:hypothetical protein
MNKYNKTNPLNSLPRFNDLFSDQNAISIKKNLNSQNKNFSQKVK